MMEPVAEDRIIKGINVRILKEQCERLAEPIRANTRSFQFASALDNCVVVINALEARELVLTKTIEQLQGPLSVASLVARAEAAEARIATLEAENAKLKSEREEADHKLVDRYRDPKTGTFSFPGDVAAIVRRLDAAEARTTDLEAQLDEALAGNVVPSSVWMEQLEKTRSAEALLKEAGPIIVNLMEIPCVRNDPHNDGLCRAARAIHHKIGVKDE